MKADPAKFEEEEVDGNYLKGEKQTLMCAKESHVLSTINLLSQMCKTIHQMVFFFFIFKRVWVTTSIFVKNKKKASSRDWS